ncbi:hypothetical protein K501DRAFT_164781, partial [Backusella circina FSU 941]
KYKSNNMDILYPPIFDRLFKKAPTYKFVSQFVIVDCLYLNSSLACIAISKLEAQYLINPVSHHHAQIIYSR